MSSSHNLKTCRCWTVRNVQQGDERWTFMSISESSLQPVLSSSGFMLVSVMAGVTRSEVSSCYKVRTQSHTFTLTFSLLGGCHVDKLHRHGPRDHGTGLRGVSHSVSGKRRRPKHRKSETPAILWLTRFDFKYNLTTWPHKARMSFGFNYWFL